MADPVHALISSVKDEGPFLLEWVAHHVGLGFDLIGIASNDCTDGSDALLAALARAGWIAHVPHRPPEGEPPQHAGYSALRAALPLDRAGWLAVLDADELLNVHAGAHDVADLTALAGEADVISLHAMTFAGAEGGWSPGRVVPRLTGRLPLRHKANTLLKSLTREPSRFGGIHNHSMVRFRERRPLRVLEGSGARREVPPAVPLWQALRSAPVGEGAHRLAQVNHYATRWRDTYALRRRRGRGAVAPGGPERHTDSYWEERRGAEAEEPSIRRHDAAVEALMAEMLADSAVRAAQAATDAEWARRTAAVRQAMGWRHEAE